MNKVCVLSLGCAKNLTDSEVMLAALQKSGYKITCDEQEAEVMVVNTCCFIESAKQESIDTILELADYKKQGKLKLLIVAGCMGERYKEEVLEELPEVDAVCGTGDFGEIVEVIERAREKRGVYRKGAEMAPLDTKDRVLATPPYTAYLKIAEGCDNHCTYCVIPKIRGKYRSREVSSILEEARQLAQKGVKELVVIAQDTSCYGKDLEGRPTLAQLLDQLGTIDGIVWIRVHYLYPEGVDEELLEELEEALISADVGVQTSMDIIESLRDKAKEENIKDADQLKEALREIISGMMDQEPQEHTAGDGLAVILVIGVNGVGKTTLFRCILGTLTPQMGHIKMDGQDLATLPPRERARRIAYIPQIHPPTFGYTVLDTVLMGAARQLNAFRQPGAAQMRQADEALEQVGAAHLRERNFAHLSGGEQQLVLIARALAQKAEVLMMDEPTSALDYGNQLRILQMVRRLAAQGYTVILSTHNPQHALTFATTLLALHGGTAAAWGRPAQVLTPELMETLYGVRAEFLQTASGPVLAPCVEGW